MTLGKMLVVLVHPKKMRYDAGRSLTTTKKIRAVLTAVFSVILAGTLFGIIQVAAFTVSRRNVVYAAAHDSLANIFLPTQPITQSIPSEKQRLELVTSFDKQRIKNVIESWRAKVKGSASVVLLDADTNEQLAASNEGQEYFTASIYKLYIAYIALQDIDTGVHSFNDPFLNGQTRQQCLDNMIRNSDSPCAEKMMNEIPRAVLQARLVELGLKDTNLDKLTTTAADAAFVTQKVAIGEGLSAASVQLLHTAMHLQVYHDGLQKGFAGLDVYDKVGFYEVGWHDCAFIRLPSGKLVVVTVLTKDLGTRQINELAKKLQPLLVGN